MMFRNFVVAGVMMTASAVGFAQTSTGMGSMSMKTPSMHMPRGAMTASPAAEAGSDMQGLKPRLPKSPLPNFKTADTNGDGQIEWKEAKAQHVKRKFFKKEDYEHNGKLDKTEWMLVGLDTTEARQGKKTKG